MAGRDDGHQVPYSQITKNIYIGSDLCEGGACPIHGEEFAKLGICVEINLEAERREIPPKNIDMYVWLPVVDGEAPTQDQLNYGAMIIEYSVKANNVVYVHCKNGHGRSPTMVAAYLICCEHMTVEDAINSVANKRPEIHIEDVQKQALEKFYNKLHDSRPSNTY